MTRSLIIRASVVASALVVLAIQAERDPPAFAVPLIGIGAVLWALHRRQAEQHRRTRRRHWRRQVGTAALVVSGLWIVLELMLALRQTLAEVGAVDGATAGDVPGPWPGTTLVDGIVTIVAIAAALTALVGSSHRRRRDAAAELVVAGRADPAPTAIPTPPSSEPISPV